MQILYCLFHLVLIHMKPQVEERLKNFSFVKLLKIKKNKNVLPSFEAIFPGHGGQQNKQQRSLNDKPFIIIFFSSVNKN